MATEKSIQQSIKSVKLMQWNASQMNNAAQVFKAQRELEKLYKQLDQLRK